MSQEINCEDFQNLLDALSGEETSAENLSALERHAASCPQCALLLEMRRHLSLPRQDALLSGIPDEYAATMWSRVQEDIDRRGYSSAFAPFRPGAWRRALMPGLAAAALVMILTSLYLFLELGQVKKRERLLATRLERQELILRGLSRGISDAPSVGAPRGFPASLPGGGFLTQGQLTVGELIAYLEKLPRETTLLGPADSQELLSHSPGWPGSRPGARIFSSIDISDGVQAEEIIHLARELELDRGQKISTDLFKAYYGTRKPSDRYRHRDRAL
ncbi:MAG: zf-HC2 domain-containing protein [Candidatus Krumholzibacteriota bacterium]|nr:zf-HC2 domain-containing protein [Candidatus Krumholzibacteriota bacterium]